MNNVDENIRQSAKDFKNIVWPEFKDHLGGGKLIPVETVSDSWFCDLLDWQAGIDAWQVVDGGGIRGIASRVQWGSKLWNSWTVRTAKHKFGRRVEARTEFQRFTDIDFTLLKPAYIIQAYLDKKGGRLLSAACVDMQTMSRMLVGGEHGKEKLNGARDAYFVPVFWDCARKYGSIKIIENKNGGLSLFDI